MKPSKLGQLNPFSNEEIDVLVQTDLMTRKLPEKEFKKIQKKVTETVQERAKELLGDETHEDLLGIIQDVSDNVIENSGEFVPILNQTKAKNGKTSFSSFYD